MGLPANRTSTVICVSHAGPYFNIGSLYMRATVMGFVENSLQLPAGLEFVDDLETATGGYEQ